MEILHLLNRVAESYALCAFTYLALAAEVVTFSRDKRLRARALEIGEGPHRRVKVCPTCRQQWDGPPPPPACKNPAPLKCGVQI